MRAGRVVLVAVVSGGIRECILVVLCPLNSFVLCVIADELTVRFHTGCSSRWWLVNALLIFYVMTTLKSHAECPLLSHSQFGSTNGKTHKCDEASVSNFLAGLEAEKTAFCRQVPPLFIFAQRGSSSRKDASIWSCTAREEC